MQMRVWGSASVRLIIAAAIWLGRPIGPKAECRGHDLFVELRNAAPATLEAIEAEAHSTPFGRGKLFRLSRKGSAASYLFGTMHSSDPRVTGLTHQLVAVLKRARVVVLE